MNPQLKLPKVAPTKKQPSQAFELFYNAPFKAYAQKIQPILPSLAFKQTLPEFTKKLECKVPQLFAEACPAQIVKF